MLDTGLNVTSFLRGKTTCPAAVKRGRTQDWLKVWRLVLIEWKILGLLAVMLHNFVRICFSRPIRKLYLLTKFFRKFSVVSTTNPRVVMETNDHQIPSQVPWRKDWGKSSGLFLLSWKRQNRKKNLNTLLTVEENKTKSFEESVRLLWCNCVLKRQDKEIDPLYAFYGRWEKKTKSFGERVRLLWCNCVLKNSLTNGD